MGSPRQLLFLPKERGGSRCSPHHWVLILAQCNGQSGRARLTPCSPDVENAECTRHWRPILHPSATSRPRNIREPAKGTPMQPVETPARSRIRGPSRSQSQALLQPKPKYPAVLRLDHRGTEQDLRRHSPPAGSKSEWRSIATRAITRSMRSSRSSASRLPRRANRVQRLMEKQQVYRAQATAQL